MRRWRLRRINPFSQRRRPPLLICQWEHLEPTVYPGSSAPLGSNTPHSGTEAETPQSGQLVAPTAAVVSPPLEPTVPVQRKARRFSRTIAALLIGLVVVIIAGGSPG